MFVRMVNVFVQEFKCWPMNSQHLLSSVDMTRSVIPLILHLCAVWLLKKKKKKKSLHCEHTLGQAAGFRAFKKERKSVLELTCIHS